MRISNTTKHIQPDVSFQEDGLFPKSIKANTSPSETKIQDLTLQAQIQMLRQELSELCMVNNANADIYSTNVSGAFANNG